MPYRRAFERDSVAIEVGNLHPEDHFAQRRLIRRAFHESPVQPGSEKQQDEGDATTQKSESRMGETIHPSRQTDPTENHANGSHHHTQDDAVDNGRDYPNPEPSITKSRYWRRHLIRSR